MLDPLCAMLFAGVSCVVARGWCPPPIRRRATSGSAPNVRAALSVAQFFWQAYKEFAAEQAVASCEIATQKIADEHGRP